MRTPRPRFFAAMSASRTLARSKSYIATSILDVAWDARVVKSASAGLGAVVALPLRLPRKSGVIAVLLAAGAGVERQARMAMMSRASRNKRAGAGARLVI